MQEKRYIGVDWGEKRIGLALADDSTCVASPWKVVANITEVIELIKQEKVDGVVLGLPIKMSGQNENLTETFENFKKELKKEIDVPIICFDERLTSKAADALTGDKKTKAARDAVAAMLILQSYFDKEKK